MKAKRVVFIGIDGAAVELIRPWIKASLLPNFAKAAKCGYMGSLQTVIPPMTAPAWVSLSTGKNPGKHGIFDFYRLVNYQKQAVSSKDIHARHIWQLASKAGKKVIVVNPPISFPPDEVNGFFVGGMLTPSYDSEYTYPRSLKKELKELGYSIGVELDPGLRSNYARSFVMNRNAKQRQKLIKVFNDIDQKRVELIENLAQRIDWDFIYVMFEGTDRLQHYYWNDEDFYVIREHYRKIDELLGRLMKLQDGNTVYIIGSDHGFDGIKYKFFINNLLHYHRLLTPLDKAKSKDAILNYGKKAFAVLAKAKLPVQKLLTSPRLFRFYRELYRPFIDWEKTKAFMLNETSRGIWINLKNRQSNGTVDKGEYKSLREFIVKTLNSLKNPQTGEEILTAYPREEIYKGIHTHNAPDILIVTHANYSVEPVIRPNTEELAATAFTEETAIGERNADHTMEGLFMIFGAGVKSGETQRSVHINDITPTALAFMDVDVPKDMDGTVHREFLWR